MKSFGIKGQLEVKGYRGLKLVIYEIMNILLYLFGILTKIRNEIEIYAFLIFIKIPNK